MSSEILGQPLAASVFALVFAPISIYMGFEITARLSKPILSIEYVAMHKAQVYPDRKYINSRIASIVDNELYREYMASQISSFGFFDIASVVYNKRIVVDGKLAKELNEFKSYISKSILSTKKEIGAISSMDKVDKVILLNRTASPDDAMGHKDIDAKLKEILNSKLESYNKLASDVDKLVLYLEENTELVIRLGVSILNKGATDGLVRNVGFLNYRGTRFKIRRTPQPNTAEEAVAVPTYIVNKSFSRYTENAIGKIEKNTMVEFWYVVEATKGKHFNCTGTQKYHLNLYNQDNVLIQKEIVCN